MKLAAAIFMVVLLVTYYMVSSRCSVIQYCLLHIIWFQVDVV